jgi:type IV pilus assembly protein PilV
MPMNFKSKSSTDQRGASLIEVLVAILILSFGMLSMGAMMSFGVQLPKLSGYSATASSLASDYIERVRANPNGFSNNFYTAPLNETVDWSFSDIALDPSACTYPACTEATLAASDINASRRAIRRALPYGDMLMRCDVATCTQAAYGNLWVVWQEPSTFAALNPSLTDNCPPEVTSLYATPKPRCLYVRFKIE